MPTPADIIRRKAIIPSELRTKEWEAARIASQYWERFFASAGVAKYETAEAMRNLSAGIAAGRLTMGDARRLMRAELARTHYQPQAGLAGTIKDLRLPRRMDTTMGTTVAMAQGYDDHRRLIGNTDYPAQELYRNRTAKEPRDWATRWTKAAASVGWQGVAKGPMIALNDSPIWAALSRWGNPYPPFDFGSGMWTRPVKRRTAAQLGIYTPEDQNRIENQKLESFNSNAEFTPAITDADLKDALAEQLAGVAEWRGGVLAMIDRNGSRPYAPGDIGRIITASPPASVPPGVAGNWQADALKTFLSDPAAFAATTPPGTTRANLDAIQDAEMLMTRITPERGTPDLHASLTTTLDDVRTAMSTGTLTLPRTRLGWVATPSPGAMDGNVRIIVRGAKTAPRIDAAANAVGVNAAPGTHVLLGGTRYKIASVKTAGGEVTITLTEP